MFLCPKQLTPFNTEVKTIILTARPFVRIIGLNSQAVKHITSAFCQYLGHACGVYSNDVAVEVATNGAQ